MVESIPQKKMHTFTELKQEIHKKNITFDALESVEESDEQSVKTVVVEEPPKNDDPPRLTLQTRKNQKTA